jgi:photosystem II stability/assembly factor-like uncharacterized protein
LQGREDRELLGGGPANAIALPLGADGLAKPLRIGQGRLTEACFIARDGVLQAWVVEDGGLVATAARSGVVWSGWRVSRLAGSLRSIRFRDRETGLIVGEGACHLTRDGGARWETIAMSAGTLAAEWLADVAVAVASDGDVFTLW